MMLISINFITYTTEFGVQVTKSDNLVQYYSTLGKSVQIITIGYVAWCYKVVDLVVDNKKNLIQEVTGLKILGPVRNKGT